MNLRNGRTYRYADWRKCLHFFESCTIIKNGGITNIGYGSGTRMAGKGIAGMSKRNKQSTKEIYILLLRSQSLFSRVIHIATKEEYTHVSIGMGNGCMQFYSFARRYTNLPLPAGFVQENLDSGLMAKSKSAPCALYRITIPAGAYFSLRRKLKKMLPKQKRFQYSVLGTLFCFFGIEYKRENKYFCFQFVAETLNEAGVIKLTKSPALYHPVDFIKLPQAELCYKGTLGGLGNMRYALMAENC